MWAFKFIVSQSISRVLSWTIIHLGVESLLPSSNLPEYSADHTISIPIWSCSKWGLPQLHQVTLCTVRSYRTFSPLPRLTSLGGLISSALSISSRCLDVI